MACLQCPQRCNPHTLSTGAYFKKTNLYLIHPRNIPFTFLFWNDEQIILSNSKLLKCSSIRCPTKSSAFLVLPLRTAQICKTTIRSFYVFDVSFLCGGECHENITYIAISAAKRFGLLFHAWKYFSLTKLYKLYVPKLGLRIFFVSLLAQFLVLNLFRRSGIHSTSFDNFPRRYQEFIAHVVLHNTTSET